MVYLLYLICYVYLYNEKSIYSDFFLFSLMGWENIATDLFHFPVTTDLPVYFPALYFSVTSGGKVLSSH
jgi:hypothetical protein